jgi:hypothetical protein
LVQKIGQEEYNLLLKKTLESGVPMTEFNGGRYQHFGRSGGLIGNENQGWCHLEFSYSTLSDNQFTGQQHLSPPEFLRKANDMLF